MNTDGEADTNNQSFFGKLLTAVTSPFRRTSTENEQQEPTNEVVQEEVNQEQLSQISQAQQVVAIKDETAFGRLKESLHSVKVSKFDADELQRKLEGELFDKWSEACEVMSAKQILFSDIDKFLDHMQDAYEGIDDDIRRKLNGVLFSESTWEYRLVEWKFNKGDESGARYGMIAFGRSPDQKYVDCMYVLYKMDFKIAQTRMVTEKTHSWFWGLLTYTTEEVELTDRALGTKSIESMQNFFRVKALQGFYNEGLIDSINYVRSLEEASA